MQPIIRDEYLVTEVMTAPPQKLQLMLLDAVLRFAAKAKEHWQAGDNEAAGEALLRCQQIVSEIMAGIRPEADRDSPAKYRASTPSCSAAGRRTSAIRRPQAGRSDLRAPNRTRNLANALRSHGRRPGPLDAQNGRRRNAVLAGIIAVLRAAC